MKKIFGLLLLLVQFVWSDDSIVAHYCLDSKDPSILLEWKSPQLPMILLSNKDSIDCDTYDALLDETTSFVLGDARGFVFPNLKGDCSPELLECSKHGKKRRYAAKVFVRIPKYFDVISKNDCDPQNLENVSLAPFADTVVQVFWEAETDCSSLPDTTFTGTYNIRITGECSDSVVAKYKKEVEK
jgi:hypothetical protein